MQVKIVISKFYNYLAWRPFLTKSDYFGYHSLQKVITLIISVIAGFYSSPAFAQYTLPFGFEKEYNISVFKNETEAFSNPWAGGLNACHFGEVDLDLDGKNDLVIFDRNGNRVLTYKNLGINGEISYQFAPELAEKLPELSDWVIFADYNQDGLNDIFAYSAGFAGIKVYRNTGNSPEMFELVVYPFLTSFQGLGYVNILVTYADYPAILDLDNDGDLDLLTFWGLGSFVEMHLNESIENYGVPDSLIFRKTNNCWGRFAESDESNVIYLDTCFGEKTAFCPQNQENNLDGDPKHTGSTFLVFDANGDGLNDLLLGDVDYSSPALLINGGTPAEALMVSHSFEFPAYDVPVDLWSFPVMNYLDLNNDGTKDMIASVFDPSLVKSENINNVWFYQNNGTTDAPLFELKTKSLFQDEMLDFGGGAYPVLFDYNNDGLLDVVVGNFGYLDSAWYGAGSNLYCSYRSQLALLENTGTSTQPAFRLVTSNYLDLPSLFPEDEPLLAAAPTFGDLDGDGDADLLLGNSTGTLIAFENIAAAGQTAQFALSDVHFQNIDAGDYSFPQLFDLNSDGLKDLIVGKRNGTISWYQNTGNQELPIFTLISDSLGKVDVRDPNLSVYGYCRPHFFTDENGKMHLFAGSEFGGIFYYTEIENNLDGAFKLLMKNYLWIDEGLQTALTVGNLNNDVYPDMLVGNYSGGLGFFSGTPSPPAGYDENSDFPYEISIFPNPLNDFFKIKLDKRGAVCLHSWQIFDISGRMIADGKTGNSTETIINTNFLKPGIYFLKAGFSFKDHPLNFKTIKIVKHN